MSQAILLTNSIFVGVYGCVLAAAFCGLGKTGRERWQIAGVAAAILAIQGGYCLWVGSTDIRAVYPLLTHLPLALALCLLTKRWMWACGSVFMAYLCCQLRRWLALLALLAFSDGDTLRSLLEILVTVPLLLALLRYVAPTVADLAGQTAGKQLRFCLIPILYYFYDYLATVYTDWLYGGKPAVVEFMPFVCCVAYLWFLLRTSAEERKRATLERDRSLLRVQVEQSVRELSALRDAQQRAAAYRHDLRHHLQYLSACMENGEISQAQSYIHAICQEIDAQKVIPYCENEAVNLILSAFAGRAAKAEVDMDIHVALSPIPGIPANDLCVILSNGLENALNACVRLPERADRKISVRGYERDGKLFLQIANPCPEPVRFEGGLPVTDQPGHGVGTRSIQAVVHRCGGLCSFSAADGQFMLRVAL